MLIEYLILIILGNCIQNKLVRDCTCTHTHTHTLVSMCTCVFPMHTIHTYPHTLYACVYTFKYNTHTLSSHTLTEASGGSSSESIHPQHQRYESERILIIYFHCSPATTIINTYRSCTPLEIHPRMHQVSTTSSSCCA